MISKEDMCLLSHLRKDARASLVKISEGTGMALSTVYEKLRKFEESIIKKHTCIIDFKKLGYNVRVNVVIKVDKTQRESMADYLSAHDHINRVYRVNSNHDYMLEGLFRDYSEFREFMEQLEEKFSIEDKQIYHLIDDIKEEEFLALKQ